MKAVEKLKGLADQKRLCPHQKIHGVNTAGGDVAMFLFTCGETDVMADEPCSIDDLMRCPIRFRDERCGSA
jgi:hypothetical protein